MTPAKTAAQPLMLRVTKTIDSPRERVFKAWTDAEQLKQWMGPADDIVIPLVNVDLRVGGKYRIQMKMADGEFYTAVGMYREIKAPERLVFTWDWEKDGSGTEYGEVEGNETVVTVEFISRGQQTEVVLTHEKLASVESRDHHEQGWHGCLAKLAKFTEKK